MKMIELDKYQVEKNDLRKAVNQVNKLFPFVKSLGYAQEAIITRISRGLDNRFVMVCNLPLEGTREKFPPILIGPSGLVMLNISPAQGYFRAKEESWWEMSKTTHRYGPGRPNLIKQTQEYAQRLAGMLDKHNKSHPVIVPVLVFANPGVEIETINPAIRVVRMDGVEVFVSDLLNSPEVLSMNQIIYLSDALEILVKPEKAIPQGEGEDYFGRDLVEPKKKEPLKLPSFKLPRNLSSVAIEEKLNLTAKQWIIIEVLMVLTILILLAGMIYILVIYR